MKAIFVHDAHDLRLGDFRLPAPGRGEVTIAICRDMNLPVNAITAKELDLHGSFRFHEEFSTAVRLMQAGLINVDPLLTHSFPYTEFIEAFDTAADRSKSMKVQLDFTP